MKSRNHYKAIVILFFLPVLSFADVTNKSDNVDKVFEYTTCSAFFAVLAFGMRDKPEANAMFNEMSEQMMDQAILLADEDYAGNSADEKAKKILKEMDKGEENAKHVIRLYASHCKVLLQQAGGVIKNEQEKAKNTKR